MTWEMWYQTKTAQRFKNRQRCEWCGRRMSTHSHHLFRRRPDHAILQEDWNIVQLCVSCHSAEAREMQVDLALKKLHRHGPDYIRDRIEALNTKVDHGLPSHFLDALEMYDNGNGS